MLLGRDPKDFDIVTNAWPEHIRKLFRNCHLVGRRFRLAHVRFGREIVEVATFRASESRKGDAERVSVNGRIIRDNVYGTLEEDAWRRDLSINCLYYNIRDFTVLDFAGGMDDLNAGVVRLVGDPELRCREDPVRILRAIRFAAKLGFEIAPSNETALRETTYLLEDISPARLYDEVLKLFLGGHALPTFEALRRYEAFGYLFPQTGAYLEQQTGSCSGKFVKRALENTDLRVSEDKPVTPAFLFAALLWGPIQRLADSHLKEGMSEIQSMEKASIEILSKQSMSVALPRRFSTAAREICTMQPRFAQRVGKRPMRLLTHPRFRAAYDFLLLRAQSGEDVQDLGAWWTDFVNADDASRGSVLHVLKQRSPRRRGRRRKHAV